MVSDEVHKSDINKGLQYINFSPLKVFRCIVPTDEIIFGRSYELPSTNYMLKSLLECNGIT